MISGLTHHMFPHLSGVPHPKQALMLIPSGGKFDLFCQPICMATVMLDANKK